MLGKRRGQWANINPPLGQRLVFTGTTSSQKQQNIPDYNANLMLGQRHRRWANIKPTLSPHVVKIETYTANHDYIVVFILFHQVLLGMKCVKFTNVWPQIEQILLIFNHLKYWVSASC